ncbi:hypothetical protein SDC9_113044 [bioreactor metagenome]|uniref:Uncharacterized protein n=1 Tax=bioreactor metagenome TaxID=1076179 RepID=A0A645BLM7_9ZZZZ
MSGMECIQHRLLAVRLVEVASKGDQEGAK